MNGAALPGAHTEIKSMYRVYRVLSVVLALTLAASCSNPKAIKITSENKDDLLKVIKDEKGLTGDEMRLLIAYQMRQAAAKSFGGTAEDPVGKTIGDIVDSQRKFETDAEAKQKEADRLAAEAKAKQDALAAELTKSIRLTVFDKGFVPKNIYASRFNDYITIKCAYENAGSKDIRAFTGRVEFTDLFGKPVYASSLTINDPIKGGTKGQWDGSIEYNEFNDAMKAFANSDLANLRVKWVPTGVIFSDGSSLGETAP